MNNIFVGHFRNLSFNSCAVNLHNTNGYWAKSLVFGKRHYFLLLQRMAEEGLRSKFL
ncbi:hypothetical protein AALB_1305 [Agarivorans albus MKT 106]|uniref:Uncharacterized protein n=1 Tax=Agarivorans albus MKT 106 TaxID=1331007 RepID=R9PIP3_AGAAL|nr:hypothetical protein AALB_1305 [Agarivorans albus MKT 106]